MRKFQLLAAFAVIAASTMPVLAGTECQDAEQRSTRSPHGGCESAAGEVTCDAEPTGGLVHGGDASGVELCVSGSQTVPLEGRYGIHDDGSRFGVYADTGESNAANPVVRDALGVDWVRVDLERDGGLCLLRGSEGSAWLSGEGHDPSAEESDDLPPLPLNPSPGNGWSSCFYAPTP